MGTQLRFLAFAGRLGAHALPATPAPRTPPGSIAARKRQTEPTSPRSVACWIRLWEYDATADYGDRLELVQFLDTRLRVSARSRGTTELCLGRILDKLNITNRAINVGYERGRLRQRAARDRPANRPGPAPARPPGNAGARGIASSVLRSAVSPQGADPEPGATAVEH